MTRLKPGKKTRLHKKVCREFLSDFCDTHGYFYCEECERVDLPPYTCHHIVAVSRISNDPRRHDDINLMCACVKCHDRFHAGEDSRLLEERGLLTYFGLEVT
jgi:hypothetical protein